MLSYDLSLAMVKISRIGPAVDEVLFRPTGPLRRIICLTR